MIVSGVPDVSTGRPGGCTGAGTVPERAGRPRVGRRPSATHRGKLASAENRCQPEECSTVPPPPRRVPKRKVNPLHAKRIVEVDWKDVTLLRTFISDRGKIRARRVTGLTPQQQRRVATAIRNAREMALLPYPRAGRG
jgi:small subunit ribosomal protein S18